MHAVVRWSVAAILMSCLGLAMPAAAGVEVIGDDAGDRYAGSGGILLPASAPRETRQEVSRCPDCRWRITTPCVNSPDEGAQAACRAMLTGCAAGEVRLRVWFTSGGDVRWRDLGLVCVGPDGPVTVGDVERALREEFERLLPSLRPSTQPSQGVLPHLPVLFHSGQPGAWPESRHTILGHAVVLRPRVTWSWTFGDGGILTTGEPGSRYPHTAVSHVYRSGGLMRVAVVAHWTASFELDDLGVFPVRDAVLQQAQIAVEVGQARAVLVPGGPQG